jgi:hypothetical protein
VWFAGDMARRAFTIMAAHPLATQQFDYAVAPIGDQDPVAVVIFRGLPRQPVSVNAHRHRGHIQRLESLAPPVWEGGEHRLIGGIPNAEPETGRPLSRRPGQIEIGVRQLQMEGPI